MQCYDFPVPFNQRQRVDLVTCARENFIEYKTVIKLLLKVKIPSVKAYRGSRDIVYSFFNLGATWVNVTPPLL